MKLPWRKEEAPQVAAIAPERSVLFVCMGTICRSPTAEAVFRAAAERAGLGTVLHVDSAGTGDWHIGEPPDKRTITAAQARGYDLTPLRARQVEPPDFERFHWILAMDRANLRVLTAMRPPEYPGHVGLFLDMAPQLDIREVPDPYYGGPDGFEQVIDLIERGSESLLGHIRRRLRLDTASA